jgi:hypothetical protein
VCLGLPPATIPKKQSAFAGVPPRGQCVAVGSTILGWGGGYLEPPQTTIVITKLYDGIQETRCLPLPPQIANDPQNLARPIAGSQVGTVFQLDSDIINHHLKLLGGLRPLEGLSCSLHSANILHQISTKYRICLLSCYRE